MGGSIPDHGKKHRYDKYGCRCELCKAVKRASTVKRYYKNNPKGTKRAYRDTPEDGKTRVCITCEAEKDIEDFTRCASKALGRDYECRVCHNARTGRNKSKPTARYSTYKCGARVRGIPFNLTFEQFMTLWQTPCDYCGAPIETIGIDRKDSNGPYELSNCSSCCSRCNKAKGILDRQSFIEMCKTVAKRFPD